MPRPRLGVGGGPLRLRALWQTGRTPVERRHDQISGRRQSPSQPRRHARQEEANQRCMKPLRRVLTRVGI